MPTLRNLMAIAASLGILAGCGGASNTTLSYSAFSTAANAICKNFKAELKKAGTAEQAVVAVPGSLPSAVPIVTKLGTEIQDAVAKFNALSGPAALQSARDKLVSALDQFQTPIQNMISAARSDNTVAFNSAVTQLHAAGRSGGGQAASSELGAPACSSS